MATTTEDTGARFGAAIFSIYLGVALLTFSTVELFSWDHRRVWGSIVASLYGFYGFTVLGSLYFAYYFTQLSVVEVLRFLGYFSVLVAGFLGGFFGVFWKTSWKKGASVAAYAAPARLALIGGSTVFLLLVPFLFFASLGQTFVLFSIPALLVSASGVALYRTRWRPRLLGIVIVGGSLGATLPFFYIVSALFHAGPYFYPLLTNLQEIWAYIAIAGMVVAIIGGLQTIFRKKETANPEIRAGSP
jgi:hypothetical protein